MEDSFFRKWRLGSRFWREAPGGGLEPCTWLRDRKHDLALAALDKTSLRLTHLELQSSGTSGRRAPVTSPWQLQRAHQTKTGNKGRPVLVFDDHSREAANFSDLVYAPPAWTGDYYDRPKKPALDKIVDTPFAVKSHQVGLIRVADVFAAVFRRYAELQDFGQTEKYSVSLRTLLSGWRSSNHGCRAAAPLGQEIEVSVRSVVCRFDASVEASTGRLRGHVQGPFRSAATGWSGSAQEQRQGGRQ